MNTTTTISSTTPFPPMPTDVDDDSSYYYDDTMYDDEDGGAATRFCGDPLWVDAKLGRWSSAVPVLTWCLQHAVLANIPVLFFFAMLPILLVQINNAKRRQQQRQQQLLKAGQEEELKTILAAINEGNFAESPSPKQQQHQAAPVSTAPASLPYDTVAQLRHLLTTMMIADKLFIFLRPFYEEWWLGEQVPLVEFVYPAMQIATLLGLLWAEERCRVSGLVSPGVIFCTWLLLFLTGIPEFYVWLRLGSDPSTVVALDLPRYLAYLIWFPMCTLQLLLNFLSTAPRAKEPIGLRRSSTEYRASFPSRQFFTWFTPVVKLGRKRPLRASDVYQMDASMLAENLYAMWKHEWDRRLLHYQSKQRRIFGHHGSPTASTAALEHRQHLHFGTHEDAVQVGNDDPYLLQTRVEDERTPLLAAKEAGRKEIKTKPMPTTDKKAYGSTTDGGRKGGERSPHHKVGGPGAPSVVSTLFSLFKWDIVGASGINLLGTLLSFANPLLLSELLRFIELGTGGDGGVASSSSLWYGFTLAVAMFLASEMRSLLNSRAMLVMYRVSVQAQSLLTSVVYAKTLRLSSGARRRRSTGEVTNLLATDVERFQALIPQLQLYWSSPLQVVIALYLLAQTIGWAVLGGAAVMLLLVPANLLVSVHVKRWQLQQMTMKDERLKMTNEVLSGIRVVKLYAWEPPMMRIIEKIRDHEVLLIKKAALLRTCVEAFNVSSPFLVAIASFALYTLTDPVNHLLTPRVAFVSLALFSQLRMPMIMIAELVSMTVQAMVSGRRLSEFLMEEEVDDTAVERDLDPNYERSIDVEFTSFEWPDENGGSTDDGAEPPHRRQRYPYTLNDVQLHVKRGILVTVLGEVGSGKSSMLAALVGEMPKVYGYVGMRGRIAYCPQQSWILNRTLRANITLQMDDDSTAGGDGPKADSYDSDLYAKVIEACDLHEDLAQLPKGDLTLIGEKGVNLSGGQKARISLARALYQQADIYLLDDPLSAVDAIVARHLFDKAIGPASISSHATRILVSHSLAFVAESDLIVVLEGRQVKRQGTYKELVADPEIRHLITRLESGNGGEFIDSLSTDSSNDSTQQMAIPAAGDSSDVIATVPKNYDAGNRADEESEPDSGDAGKIQSRRASSVTRKRRKSKASSSVAMSMPTSPTVEQPDLIIPPATGGGDQQEVEEELAAIGRVSSSVYASYFKAMGLLLVGGFVVFIVGNTVMNVLTGFWLSSWSDENAKEAAVLASSPSQSPATNASSTAEQNSSLAWWLGGYALIGFAGVAMFCVANVCLLLGGVNASLRLHHPLLVNLLRSRIAFFDTTPVGRILNRVGKEMDTVDLRLGPAFRFLTISFLVMVQVFVVIAISTPLFIAVLVPVTVVYVAILRGFIPASRQLQRLNSIARSPLYTRFTEAIQGVTSIRAYGMEEKFFKEFRAKIDFYSACNYYSLVANRWLSVRLELLGSLIILSSASLAVLAQSDWLSAIGLGGAISAGLAGLSVSRSLDITYMLGFFIREINDVETRIVAVERIREYSDSRQQEAPWSSEPTMRPPPRGWPSHGSVSLRNLTCTYRPTLPPCLVGINVEIKAGERVGVVGRTGAGKSSLVRALMRLIEPSEGKIFIDGLDIATIGLHELRLRCCTVIPQEPVLFSGTLRFNLDPFGERTDRELWLALERAHLKDFVMARPGALQHSIAEMGENLSVGQRQLICLARAILRRTPILICDEATASVDQRTDALIQDTLREEFGHSTVISIAHRLSTILDCDRVMVMEQGRLAEFDSPAALLSNPRSLFHALAAEDAATTSTVQNGAVKE